MPWELDPNSEDYAQLLRARRTFLDLETTYDVVMLDAEGMVEEDEEEDGDEEFEDYAFEQARESARALPSAVRDDEIIGTWETFRSDPEQVGERLGAGTGHVGEYHVNAYRLGGEESLPAEVRVHLWPQEPSSPLESAQHVFDYVCEAGPTAVTWERVE